MGVRRQRKREKVKVVERYKIRTYRERGWGLQPWLNGEFTQRKETRERETEVEIEREDAWCFKS